MTKDLNYRSAVEIMGYSFTEHKRKAPGISPPTYVEGVEYWDAEGNKVYWSPLTDLNQCFMVAEKMRELGWTDFRLERPNEERKDVYYCDFTIWDKWQQSNWAEADTPNEAILKAAIKAVKGDSK